MDSIWFYRANTSIPLLQIRYRNPYPPIHQITFMTKELREKLKEMLKWNYSILYSNLYNEKTNKWRYNARTLLSFMENIELAKNLEIIEAERRMKEKCLWKIDEYFKWLIFMPNPQLSKESLKESISSLK